MPSLPVSVHDVANYFLSLVDEEAGDGISNLKMQKLVYYAQGFHLALHDAPLFAERIEAWQHGPVVPDLYHALKVNGAQPIPVPAECDVSMFTAQQKSLLDEVFAVYGQFSALKLRDLTHEEAPWKEAPDGAIIPLPALQAFFRGRLAQ